MDGSEIVKHIPEIASAAKVVAASVPFTAIVKRMLGPAADEVAEMWGDQVRLYRYERQLKCVGKAERMAQEAGFTPQAVPPKILFPLLEGASFEDNEDLHTMWAALLANAASPEKAKTVRPGFIAVLKQMAPDEGLLLNALFDRCFETAVKLSQEFRPGALFFIGGTIDRISQDLGQDPVAYQICLDRLQSQHLLQRRFDDAKSEIFMLTVSAFHFVTACRPPK